MSSRPREPRPDIRSKFSILALSHLVVRAPPHSRKLLVLCAQDLGKLQRLLVPMESSGIFKEAEKAKDAITKFSDTMCGKKRKAVAIDEVADKSGSNPGSKGRGKKGKGKAKKQPKKKTASPTDSSVVSMVASELRPGRFQ